MQYLAECPGLSQPPSLPKISSFPSALMLSSTEDCCCLYVLSTAACKYFFPMLHECGVPNGHYIHVAYYFRHLCRTLAPNRIPHDIIMLPTGVSPMDGWESQLLMNEHKRHFCTTVILVPILEWTCLSHSVRHTRQNSYKLNSKDSASRNNFCSWAGGIARRLSVKIRFQMFIPVRSVYQVNARFAVIGMSQGSLNQFKCAFSINF